MVKMRVNSSGKRNEDTCGDSTFFVNGKEARIQGNLVILPGGISLEVSLYRNPQEAVTSEVIQLPTDLGQVVLPIMQNQVIIIRCKEATYGISNFA